MNDELNTALNELEEATKEDESIASVEGTDDTSSDDDLDVEDLLKTSSEAPKKSASEIAEQQKEAWAKKIASGKKTLEDLENTPSAKWMIQDVKKRLGISPSEEDIESRIKAYDSDKQFKQDLETFKSLPIEAKKELKGLIEEYIDLGVNPNKALRKSLEKSKVIIDKVETERKKRVETGQLPTGKTASGTPVYKAEDVAKMTQAEYNEFKRKERAGEVILKLK